MTIQIFSRVDPNYVATAKDKANLNKMMESIRAGDVSLDSLNELFLAARAANMAAEIIPGYIKAWLAEYKKFVSSHWNKFRQGGESHHDAEFEIACNAQWGRNWLLSAKSGIKEYVYKEVWSYLDLIEKYWNTEDDRMRQFVKGQQQQR